MLSLLPVSVLSLALLALPSSAFNTLAEFQSELLVGLQTLGSTQTTGVLQSIASNSSYTSLIERAYANLNSSSYKLFAPTNEAWSAYNGSSDMVETIARHLVSGSINIYYNTEGYEVDSTSANSTLLPGNASEPLVVLSSNNSTEYIVRGYNYNATSTAASSAVGALTIIPVDTVITSPPTLKTALSQALVPQSVNETTSENKFDNLISYLNGLGYLDQFDSISEGFTIFAPTDSAFTRAGSSLSSLTDTEKAVVAMNHVFKGEVLYSPILAGSAQLTSGSGGSLSWCNGCGNSTSQTGLSMLVVGTNISANVLRTDVILNNGVLHVIDGILLNTKNNTKSANQASTTGKKSSTSSSHAATASATSASKSADVLTIAAPFGLSLAFGFGIMMLA